MEVETYQRSSAKSASTKIKNLSQSKAVKGFEEEIAIICSILHCFQEPLMAPLVNEFEQLKNSKKEPEPLFEFVDHAEFEHCLRFPSLASNRQTISNTIKVLLEHFPKRRKVNNATWPFLLRKVLDLYLEDYGSATNPIKCGEKQIVDPANLKEHPFFSLSLDTQVKILFNLANWVLETENIKKAIDIAMKASSLKGLRPAKATLSHIGFDRNKSKVFHHGISTRIYLQDAVKLKITIATSTMEEMEAFVSTLQDAGSENVLKKHFTKVIKRIREEIAERNRKEEAARLKVWKKEQKRLEYEQLLLQPRRSDRSARGQAAYSKYFDQETSSTDEDDVIMNYSTSDDEEEEEVIASSGDTSGAAGEVVLVVAEEDEDVEKSVISTAGSLKENGGNDVNIEEEPKRKIVKTGEEEI